jgi:hypothetical protein
MNFGLGFTAVRPVGQLSSIRLTGMRLVAVPGIDHELAAVPVCAAVPLLAMSCPSTTLVLEDCTFEAAFDLPKLDRVVACRVEQGAHVSLEHKQTSARRC